jgi:transcriptional regulator with XRE-family HTH domain
MLSYAERKERLPFGANERVAERLGVSSSYVSAVLSGRQSDPTFDIERALARLMKPKTSAKEAFGDAPRSLRKRPVEAAV